MIDTVSTTGADPWIEHMLSGNFSKAWEVSDTVMLSRTGKSCWHLPRHKQYVWNGSPLDGKRVLVRCYHGLGDTIQFIRYVPLIRSRAAQVTVWAQAELIPVLESMPCIDQLLALHDGAPEATFDVDVEIMELPYIFRSTLETIPANVPYLFVEPGALKAPEGKVISVGLVWQAGNWDERRSIPFADLTALAAIEGVSLCILQADAPAAGWKPGIGMYPGQFSLFEYARIIAGLDLLISVDSMPAHLAGALGRPVWTLLHAEADWRWMKNRNDSPWYPTMRLFRQERQGDWTSVIREVAGALKDLAAR